MEEQKRRRTKSQQTAICGIFAALQTAVMFIFSLTSVGTYAGPVAASFLLVPVIIECGRKNAVLVYITSTVLSLVLIPDKTLGLFSLLFGWYPVALIIINQKVKNRFLRAVIKLAVCYSAVLLELFMEMKILGIPTGFDSVASWIIWLIAVLGGVSFLLLDVMYTAAKYIWERRIKKYIRL